MKCVCKSTVLQKNVLHVVLYIYVIYAGLSILASMLYLSFYDHTFLICAYNNFSFCVVLLFMLFFNNVFIHGKVFL